MNYTDIVFDRVRNMQARAKARIEVKRACGLPTESAETDYYALTAILILAEAGVDAIEDAQSPQQADGQR